MLQVLPPSTAMKVCHQPCGITVGGPWPTSPLRLGSLRCWWWWWWDTGRRPGGQIALLTRRLRTSLPRYTSWATDGSAAASPPPCAGSSTVWYVTHWGGFISGGVSSDSPPRRLLWQLYCLLVGRGRTHRVWLSERQCLLGHAWHQHGWRWHLLGQSAWMGHPHNPLRCAPQIGGPPDPREVWWASIWRSLWEGGLVGVVGTRTSLLQGYQEWSCLLRRQLLCTQATPLLPGSMMEGRLPCKRTWSLGGSRSGNTPIQLSSQAARVEPQLGGSLRCPG